MLVSFKDPGNLLVSMASKIQFVEKFKEKSYSFKIFSGISPQAALFEDKSFTRSLKNSSETGLKEDLLVILF